MNTSEILVKALEQEGNDSGLGMIRMKQMADGYGTLGVDFGSHDFAKIAVGIGAHGHHVTKTMDIPRILQRAKTQGGVHVIDVPVDYRENQGLMQEMMMVNWQTSWARSRVVAIKLMISDQITRRNCHARALRAPV